MSDRVTYELLRLVGNLVPGRLVGDELVEAIANTWVLIETIGRDREGIASARGSPKAVPHRSQKHRT